jgi:predicted double-glycine peptidase
MFKKSNYKIVLQKRNYDCGVAATSMLLANSGVKMGYKTIEKRLNVTKEGVSCAVIARYVKTFKNLKPRVMVNSKIKDLRSQLEKGRICMVVYQSWGKRHEQEALLCGHYSVAVRMTKTRLYLLDPGAYEDWGSGKGFRIMKINSFEKKWVDRDFGKIIKSWMISVKPLVN